MRRFIVHTRTPMTGKYAERCRATEVYGPSLLSTYYKEPLISAETGRWVIGVKRCVLYSTCVGASDEPSRCASVRPSLSLSHLHTSFFPLWPVRNLRFLRRFSRPIFRVQVLPEGVEHLLVRTSTYSPVMHR